MDKSKVMPTTTATPILDPRRLLPSDNPVTRMREIAPWAWCKEMERMRDYCNELVDVSERDLYTDLYTEFL